MAVKTFRNRAGKYQRLRQSMNRRVPAHTDWGEDILSISCELWLDKKQELKRYEIGNVYCKYIVSAVSKILHS
jgi:hypothetical protein